MRIFIAAVFLLVGLALPFDVSRADGDGDCLCIASEAVQKYCRKEREGLTADEYRVNQEAIAKRDIQRLLNENVESGFAKDAAAMAHIESDNFTVNELDGRIYSKKDVEQVTARANNYQGILRISEDTKVNIECLTFKGKDAIVYTNQHYVRYVPDRKDGSPHEIITNIIHREKWIFTEQGWRLDYVEELERGNTYLDGKIYNPE
jgi:hypothetical protein